MQFLNISCYYLLLIKNVPVSIDCDYASCQVEMLVVAEEELFSFSLSLHICCLIIEPKQPRWILHSLLEHAIAHIFRCLADLSWLTRLVVGDNHR